jgi:UDP-galactopyranose mutase
VYEYPCEQGDPYYPVPRKENATLYARYKALADATPEVYFAGRLGTYKYYNMDQVTGQALALYAKLASPTDRVTPARGSVATTSAGEALNGRAPAAAKVQ